MVHCKVLYVVFLAARSSKTDFSSRSTLKNVKEEKKFCSPCFPFGAVLAVYCGFQVERSLKGDPFQVFCKNRFQVPGVGIPDWSIGRLRALKSVPEFSGAFSSRRSPVKVNFSNLNGLLSNLFLVSHVHVLLGLLLGLLLGGHLGSLPLSLLLLPLLALLLLLLVVRSLPGGSGCGGCGCCSCGRGCGHVGQSLPDEVVRQACDKSPASIVDDRVFRELTSLNSSLLVLPELRTSQGGGGHGGEDQEHRLHCLL